MAARARAVGKSAGKTTGKPVDSPADRTIDKKPLERLHERIVTGDRGWFFANIADKVAERRVQKNLSQRELAVLCGTTQSAIARLERGGRPPRIDTLLRIAEALECELIVDLVPR
jgi:predicted transcriptional regulator